MGFCISSRTTTRDARIPHQVTSPENDRAQITTSVIKEVIGSLQEQTISLVVELKLSRLEIERKDAIIASLRERPDIE